MTDTLPKRVVHLTIDQAKAAYKDLLKADVQKSVDSIRVSQIADLKFALDAKTREVLIVEERERNLKLAFDGQTLLLADQKNRSAELEKLYKRSVRWGRFKVVLLGGAAAFIIYQSVK